MCGHNYQPNLTKSTALYPKTHIYLVVVAVDSLDYCVKLPSLLVNRILASPEERASTSRCLSSSVSVHLVRIENRVSMKNYVLDLSYNYRLCSNKIY